MRLLLDSQVFVWAKAKRDRLSFVTRAVISNPQNEVFVSVASAWELWVKHAKKPIAPIFDGGASSFLAAAAESDMRVLDIAIEHAEVAANLPPLHRDPFDRMLIAQAILGGLTLVTSDSEIARYQGFDRLSA
jgi:PIN domain nuclease of toxin-antitoxin system